jgi:hypothetical protein
MENSNYESEFINIFSSKDNDDIQKNFAELQDKSNRIYFFILSKMKRSHSTLVDSYEVK